MKDLGARGALRFRLRAVCLGLLAAGAVDTACAQNAIKAVASAMQQGVEVIQIDLARPLAAVPSSFSVASPARIALDFLGATNDVGRAAIEVNQPNLRSINVVQAGERSRVVLNLRQPVPYTAELQGNSVRVTLQAVAVVEPRTVETPAPAEAAAAPVVRSSPITLNFSNADIEAVARTMAVVTGRNVVVDPRVKGTMDLVTDRAVQPAAAFNQFAAALRLQGFAVVEADGLYKVVLEANAKLQSVAVNTSIGAVPASASNQVVTQIFRLNHESPNALMPVLRPLIPPNNTINVNPGSNSLVITDYADNMRRLARIIAALDVPNASDVEVIQLKHSIATDLIPLVQRLIDGGAPGAPSVSEAPGGADASFRTTLLADPRSNSVLMRAANPARAQLVRTLIEKLDRPPAESSNGAAGNIYVVYLKNAEAVRLAATLRAAMAANRPSGTTGAGAGALTAAAPCHSRPRRTARAAKRLASRQPALHRRPDPGRPDDQLTDHHRPRAPVPPDARRHRQARWPPRAGHDRGADRGGQRQQGRQLRRAVAKRAGQQRGHRHQLQPEQDQHPGADPGAGHPQCRRAGLPRSSRG